MTGPYFAKYGSNEAYMEAGSGTYWNTALSSNNGEFTIGGWFYMHDDEGDANTRLMSWGYWSGTQDDFGINYNKSENGVHLNIAFNGDNSNFVGPSNQIYPGKWNHILIVGKRAATYGDVLADPPVLYLNGVAHATTANNAPSGGNSTTLETINHELNIGQNDAGTEQAD